ncbi:MAG TPA: hypothetical protein VIC54_00795 [Terriglobales bacterium]|jgi:predicted NUDIX family phosphoesterase
MPEELVMAVPRAVLFEPGYFQGLQVGGGAWLERIFEPRNSRFLPRAAAEEDPSWKQVIPYVILVHEDKVFCYRRGQRSTEARLRALHSVGLGGHIRHTDDSLFTAPGRPAYDAALERELAEEVEIGAAVLSDTLVGLINDDTTPVGRVHIGLVHVRRLAAPAVRPREQKIAAPRFATVAELLGGETAELESWSRLCLEQWERL